MTRRVAWLTCAALAISTAAAAQQGLPQLPGLSANPGPQLTKVSEAMIDLSVPPSPAFNVLGLTPETVDHPTTARRFATALVNGVSRDGQLQTGLALDSAPYLLVYGDRITLNDYGRRYMVRLLSRFSVSVATAKAESSDDKAVRLALGFRATLWDLGDPRTNQELLGCFRDKLPALPTRLLLEPDDPGPAATAEQQARHRQLMAEFRLDEAVYSARVAAFSAEWLAAAEACRTDARKRSWNNSSWIIAAAPTMFSGDGSLSNLSGSGGGIWTTLSYGFDQVPGLEDAAQLSLHARLRRGEPVAGAGADSTFLEKDSTLVGAQLRAGTRDTTVALEVLRDRSRFAGERDRNHTRIGLTVERRLTENLWLNVALGEGSGRPAGQSAPSYLLSALRWGFSQARTLPVPAAPSLTPPPSVAP